jgi:hypothetical protein
MKKHVHADKIRQFAQMVAAGHPVNKLVQVQNQGCPWRTVLPHWDTDNTYRVACVFVDGKPLFDGDEAYLNGQVGYVRWAIKGTDVVFANTNTLRMWSSGEQPASLSLTAPAAKQYEITHQIGDVSVTVRAPSAAECEQMVARLDKPAESRAPDLQPPRDMTPREKEHLAQLRVMNCGRTPFQFDRRKFISSLGGIVVSNVSGILAVAVPAEMQEHAIAVLSNTQTIGVLISVNGVRVP